MIQTILATPNHKSSHRFKWLTQLTIGAVVATSIWSSWIAATWGQPTVVPDTPEICEVNFNLLKPDQRSGNANIITADTVSAQGMTLPSLWWTSEQFPPKLVTNWIANRRQKQVYLLVNAQYWDLLDYIGRYRTIDQFGRVAQGYGYNLKLCSSQKIVLAQYSCDRTNRSSCQLWLNTTGQSGMGVQNK